MTGLLGIDPGPYSLRRLLWMRRAQGFEQWQHTLALGEIIAAVQPHFGKGRKPQVNLMHLNPYADKKQSKPVRGIPLRGRMGVAILDALSVEESNGQ